MPVVAEYGKTLQDFAEKIPDFAGEFGAPENGGIEDGGGPDSLNEGLPKNNLGGTSKG